MCSSKHLDRTRSGPGSEQIRHVNSILQVSEYDRKHHQSYSVVLIF